MRQVVYSVVCASAIGYLFGVVFAVRAIQMSGLTTSLEDMLVLTGWVGMTFGLLFVPVGLLALGLVGGVHRLSGRPLSSRNRVYLLAWLVLAATLSIPFLGYYYSSGVDPHQVPGADSPWDLVPHWLVQIGRWIGFSALSAALLALPATEALTRYFGIGSGAPYRLWTPRLVGVLVVVLLTWLTPAVWLRVGSDPSPDATDAASGGVPDPESALAPIVIVGWDGVTWDVVAPLLNEGRMPNLASLIERGVRSPLRTFEPTSSPLIWTTISTGRPPGQHGVRSQVENRFAGMKRWFFFPPSMGFDRIFGRLWERAGVIERVTVTSNARKRRAFWDLLDEAGRSVGLVNWRVAWPAERFRGFNVTDHLHPSLLRVADSSGRLPAALSEADLFASMPGALEPPVRVGVLDSCLVLARKRTVECSMQTGLSADLAPEREVFASELGQWLYEDSPVDVLATYFYRLDAIEHRYWKYREPQYYFGVTEAEARQYGPAIDQVHVFYDLLLGDILEKTPDDAIVIVLSDHGHGPVFGELRRSGGHTHAPPGILVMAGPGIEGGASLQDPTVYDIFPTLMYVSGLPAERGARGRVLLEAFHPAVRESRPVREVDSYAPREEPIRDPERTSPIEEELLDRLKQLGYIG